MRKMSARHGVRGDPVMALRSPGRANRACKLGCRVWVDSPAASPTLPHPVLRVLGEDIFQVHTPVPGDSRSVCRSHPECRVHSCPRQT